MQARTNNPGMALCIIGLPAPVDYLMTKCHIPGSKGDISPDEAPSYDNFSLCQADIHNIQNNINNRIWKYQVGTDEETSFHSSERYYVNWIG